MPCRCDDYEPNPQQQINDLTVLLCEACNIIDAKHSSDMMSTELLTWWNKHIIADRERENREREERRKLALRQSAINKMTREERDAMGLSD